MSELDHHELLRVLAAVMQGDLGARMQVGGSRENQQVASALNEVLQLTEQARKQAAGLSQQQSLDAILDGLPTPLVLLDPMATECRFANRAARALAGGVFTGACP